MSDSSNLRLCFPETIPPSHFEALEAILGCLPKVGVILDLDDVNYPGDTLLDIENLRLPYLAVHGIGREYSAAVYAYDGTNTFETEIDRQGVLLCRVSHEGVPDKDNLKAIKRLIKFHYDHKFNFTLKEFCE